MAPARRAFPHHERSDSGLSFLEYLPSIHNKMQALNQRTADILGIVHKRAFVRLLQKLRTYLRCGVPRLSKSGLVLVRKSCAVLATSLTTISSNVSSHACRKSC
jgi:hypothetical protein